MSQETAERWTPSHVTRMALKGAVALSIRQVLVQGATVVGGVLLARLLTPAEFGLYAIITFVLTFLIAFGDVGLGASLIRQPHEPDEADYRAVFTMQQLLVVVVVALFWFASPWIAHAYHLPSHDAWLFRLVGLSLLFTSFQVIPSLRLERHLRFDRLAIVEVTQALAYNVVAVVLAWRGMGAMSFAIALLVRSLVGSALANIVCPWQIGWRWDWARVRHHLHFGLPYQGSNFVYLLKDSISPIFIGLLLGAGEVGYLNWAGMVAAYPVLMLMVLQRLYLPAFSRMQTHTAHLGAFVEQIIRATNALVAPFAVITLVLIHPITQLIFGDKWLIALPYFYLFWVANLFVATATPLTGLLNALGHSRTVFGFAILWMVGTWLIGAPLSLWLGGIGLVIANLVVQFTNVALVRITQRYVPFRVLPLIAPIWAWAAILGLAMLLAQRAVAPNGLIGLICYGAVGLAAYGIGLLALHPGESRRAWAWLRRQQWNRVSRWSSIP